MSHDTGQLAGELDGFPRTRGDEPGGHELLRGLRKFSPHTRG